MLRAASHATGRQRIIARKVPQNAIRRVSSNGPTTYGRNVRSGTNRPTSRAKLMIPPKRAQSVPWKNTCQVMAPSAPTDAR